MKDPSFWCLHQDCVSTSCETFNTAEAMEAHCTSNHSDRSWQVNVTQLPLVVITGVTGYLGSRVCLQFLECDAYRVRGTVRSIRNDEKINPLKALLGQCFDKLVLVEADLNDEASLLAACEGASYIIHTASPFHFKGDCIGPAVAGTSAVLKACTAHGVRKLVITSSCAAVQGPADRDKPHAGEAFTEAYWSNPDRPEGMSDYMKSKTLAERAAWEYQGSHPGFDIIAINPCFIVGPGIAGDGTSQSFMRAILRGKRGKKVPRGGQGFVDVRDVALAHLRAVQVPAAANKRFILFNQHVHHVEYYSWLAQFNEIGAKVPTVVPESQNPTEVERVDNSRSKALLGIDYTPLEQSMVEHAQCLIQAGAIVTKR